MMTNKNKFYLYIIQQNTILAITWWKYTKNNTQHNKKKQEY